LYSTQSTQESDFSIMFMAGLRARVGQQRKQDAAISIALMIEIQRRLELDWNQALERDDLVALRKVAELAVYFLFCFWAALRGFEGTKVPLHELRTNCFGCIHPRRGNRFVGALHAASRYTFGRCFQGAIRGQHRVVDLCCRSDGVGIALRRMDQATSRGIGSVGVFAVLERTNQVITRACPTIIIFFSRGHHVKTVGVFGSIHQAMLARNIPVVGFHLKSTVGVGNLFRVSTLPLQLLSAQLHFEKDTWRQLSRYSHPPALSQPKPSPALGHIELQNQSRSLRRRLLAWQKTYFSYPCSHALTAEPSIELSRISLLIKSKRLETCQSFMRTICQATHIRG
jgi:hypothetical protein